MNVVVEMSTAPGTNHQGKKRNRYVSESDELTFVTGMFMENGRYTFHFYLGMLVWFILTCRLLVVVVLWEVSRYDDLQSRRLHATRHRFQWR